MEKDRSQKHSINYGISKIGTSQPSRKARDVPVYNQSQNQNLKYNNSSMVAHKPGGKNKQTNTKSTVQSNTRLPKINQKFINKKQQQAVIQEPENPIKTQIQQLSKQGDAQFARKNFQEAFQCYEKCLELEKDLYGMDSIRLCRTLNNLGKTRHYQNKNIKSNVYYFRSLELDQTSGKKTAQTGHILHAIGYNFYQCGQRSFSKAIEYLEQAYDIFRLDPKLTNSLNLAMTACSVAYQQSGDLQKAADCYIRMFDNYRANNTQCIAQMFRALCINLKRIDMSSLVPELRKKYFSKK